MKKAILFIIILVIVIAGSVLIYQELNHTESEPEWVLSEQKLYHFNGQDYYYPTSWILEEQKYLTPGQEMAGEEPYVVGSYLRPKEQKNPSDVIGIGGRQIDCRIFTEEYLCSSPGNYFGTTPIYTKSKNPEVLKVYESLLNIGERIKDIQEYTEEELSYFKSSVREGRMTWFKDPLETSKMIAPQYGFNVSDDFVLKSQAASAGVAEVEAFHNNDTYFISLMRTDEIWLITSIERLK